MLVLVVLEGGGGGGGGGGAAAAVWMLWEWHWCLKSAVAAAATANNTTATKTTTTTNITIRTPIAFLSDPLALPPSALILLQRGALRQEVTSYGVGEVVLLPGIQAVSLFDAVNKQVGGQEQEQEQEQT